jgi:hypothetical protein
MAQRLALGITPGTGWRAVEIRSMAQAAKAAGFEAIARDDTKTARPTRVRRVSRPRLLMLDEPSLASRRSWSTRCSPNWSKLTVSARPCFWSNRMHAWRWPSRTAPMFSAGRIVAEGPAQALADDERVKNAYLGIAA